MASVVDGAVRGSGSGPRWSSRSFGPPDPRSVPSPTIVGRARGGEGGGAPVSWLPRGDGVKVGWMRAVWALGRFWVEVDVEGVRAAVTASGAG